VGVGGSSVGCRSKLRSRRRRETLVRAALRAGPDGASVVPHSPREHECP
jgi:hypothetical protein